MYEYIYICIRIYVRAYKFVSIYSFLLVSSFFSSSPLSSYGSSYLSDLPYVNRRLQDQSDAVFLDHTPFPSRVGALTHCSASLHYLHHHRQPAAFPFLTSVTALVYLSLPLPPAQSRPRSITDCRYPMSSGPGCLCLLSSRSVSPRLESTSIQALESYRKIGQKEGRRRRINQKSTYLHTASELACLHSGRED